MTNTLFQLIVTALHNTVCSGLTDCMNIEKKFPGSWFTKAGQRSRTAVLHMNYLILSLTQFFPLFLYFMDNSCEFFTGNFLIFSSSSWTLKISVSLLYEPRVTCGCHHKRFIHVIYFQEIMPRTSTALREVSNKYYLVEWSLLIISEEVYSLIHNQYPLSTFSSCICVM